MHIFFEPPFFDTLTNCQKFIFAPLHTICVLDQQKHYKTGKNKQQKILDRFSRQPWTDFQLKKGQILDRFSTLQHMFIYIYMALDWSAVNILAKNLFFAQL